MSAESVPPTSLHVFATRWEEAAPVLLVRDPAGDVAALRPAGRFRWRVLDGRTCTGHHDGGGWRPCPDGAAVTADSQCLPCFRGRREDAPSARDHPACIFEPLCAQAPQHCACSFGAVEHVVYVAFHGLLPKVGMTQARRVVTRLREQGADAYLVAERCPDRATARAAERRLAFLHRVPEWRSHEETLPQLVRPVPWERIEARAAALAATLADRFRVEPGLHRLHHALAQPLAGRPRRVPTVGEHAGAWLGCKGNHLFYQEAPRPGRLDVGMAPVAALRRDDLAGRRIEVG